MCSLVSGDPIRQVTLCSCEMEFHLQLYTPFVTSEMNRPMNQCAYCLSVNYGLGSNRSCIATLIHFVVVAAAILALLSLLNILFWSRSSKKPYRAYTGAIVAATLGSDRRGDDRL